MKVPKEYWEDLEKRNVEDICKNALTRNHPPQGLLLPFLGECLLVDIQNHSLSRQAHGDWERVGDPILELSCLAYLLNVGPEPLSHEMIGVQELKNAHFFRGPHDLKVRPLLERCGHDLDLFKSAAERLGSDVLDLADVAYKIPAFPKVPLYYLFWAGDQEFEPRLSILFDRSIEHHLAADVIWGLVNLVSDILLTG